MVCSWSKEITGLHKGSVYALGVTVFQVAVTNPETYAQLFKDGAITLKEFRSYISDPLGTITKTLQEINTRDSTINELINKDLTEATYKYSKKKGFVFISSDGDSGYQA